jgi:hypothetical protein
MIRITVYINDRRVWNPMRTAAEICTMLNKHDQIELFFNNEAPNIIDTELPEFFNTLKLAGVDLSRITVVTGNIREKYDQVNLRIDPTAMYELTDFQRVVNYLPKHKNIKHHFGMLVGRCTMPRLTLASHLYTNYRDKTLQTFHWQGNSDYHKTHLELESIIHEYGINSIEFDEAVQLLKHAPLLQHAVNSYPICHPENLHTPCNWYPTFFVDLICETWYLGDTFCLTEKFWRSITTRTPFIIHGPQWIIQRLHQLGFQTFGDWWSEGYSEDPGNHSIIEIKHVLKYLSEKTVSELNEMYGQMMPVLNHNLEVFNNLKYSDFIKLRSLHA